MQSEKVLTDGVARDFLSETIIGWELAESLTVLPFFFT
jgi:hypothetical protein